MEILEVKNTVSKMNSLNRQTEQRRKDSVTLKIYEWKLETQTRRKPLRLKIKKQPKQNEPREELPRAMEQHLTI